MNRPFTTAFLTGAAFAAAAVTAAAAAEAAETIAYSYDARGRLIVVKRSTSGSGAPAPTTTTYQFDKADNRTAKTTRSPYGGAGRPSPCARPAAPIPGRSTPPARHLIFRRPPAPEQTGDSK
jgi:YD repeat-containing protein